MKKLFYSFLFATIILVFSLAYLGSFDYVEISNLVREKHQEIFTGSCESPRNDSDFQYNFLSKYKTVLNCNLNSRQMPPFSSQVSAKYDYSKPADSATHELRVTRGVVVYFPIEKYEDFLLEFKWLYRSWIEMQKYEPTKWRTDLVVFINVDHSNYKKDDFLMKSLNCSILYRRNSSIDEPMCTLINYKALKERNLDIVKFDSQKELYEHVLNKINVFNDEPSNLKPFYSLLNKISDYGYLDSILMSFDGYEYFRKAGYNFLIRSDMDVFLTPLFGQWLPRHCNDFYVGRGGYSSPFNERRLRRKHLYLLIISLGGK